ncbi:amidohydrolase [Xanthocytophaga agilis]|uniref:Amidohydrolase n=1 Tax=Xanthocytophaga agilis TaxID=3048010 RepID=A0AAE3QXZ1_9BACT|nr:amidohydrolase [Xanthocytophaga agilis]MDJ1499535.1 amidohydrolase [Xanthocytophaga agilis]
MKKVLLFLLCADMFLPVFSQKMDGTNAKVKAFVDKSYASWYELYTYLHANPEISFQEKKTMAKMGALLREAGFEVTENFGGYGVVGVLRNGKGPTIMVRTDLDALPVKEETGLPYASKVIMQEDGRDVSAMHACGHDLHMTVFTGTAQALSMSKSEWKGTLVFIGQPAEERSGGAIAMLRQGLYEKFPRPDYVVGLHDHAAIPAGKVGYTEGPMMASVDAVDITVRGIGGHGAMPHTTKDPIVLASQIVLALQTIVSRETSPFQPCVVTVGSIHGGSAYNIIGNEVKLQLTLRSFDDSVRVHTIAAIKRICNGTAQAAGIPEDLYPVIKIRDQYTPSNINDVALTKRLVGAFRQVLGNDNVVNTPPSTVGEDFARFSRIEPKIPTCMFWLGAVDPKKFEESMKTGKQLPSLHSSTFAPLPEPAIKTGVEAMSSAVLELLKSK